MAWGPTTNNGTRNAATAAVRRRRRPEAPILAPVRQPFQLDHRVDQDEAGNLDITRQQRPQREPQVERLQARHVGGCGAFQIGQPDIGDSELGARQEGDLDIAVYGKLTPGQGLDAL